MKFMKVFIITLLALFLTGCYTQLQYSQTMKKITDKEKPSDTSTYSWSGEEKAESSNDKTSEDVAKAENQQEESEEYIPVYYKDYEYATKYGDVYNFYGNDWYNNYPYSRYGSFYSWHPFNYDRWAYHSFYGRWYDRPHYGLSISLSWGWPSYHYGFYDPFYDPYYDYYWHRYYSRYAYGYAYWNFYGKSGYGHGYYPDKKAREDNNVRYGPRSIGTNRVETDNNRSRVNGDRSAAVTNRTSSTVRTRSVGTTRTRDSSSSSSVNRAKSRDNSSSSPSRTRGQDQIDNSQVDRYDYRNRSDELPLIFDEKQLEQMRARISNDRKSIMNRSRLNSNRDRTPTFFNRMKDFFEQRNSSFSNGNNGGTLRTRSATINRNSSNNDRGSVTKSKSSSNNTRSRGSSSSSRSRSDDSSSSSSERSRGN